MIEYVIDTECFKKGSPLNVFIQVNLSTGFNQFSRNIDPDSYPEFTLAKVPPYLQTEEPKELSPPASSRSDDHNKNTKRKVVRVGKSAKQRSSGHSTGGSNPNGDDRSERSMNMDSTQEADSTNTMWYGLLFQKIMEYNNEWN